MTAARRDEALRNALEPAVQRLLDRHLESARDWLPHEWLPWSRGCDFGGPDGEAWAPKQSRLSEPVRAAFELNLLTEDNLPNYHHALLVRVGESGPWGAWVRRWTAEEARHAASLRDYAMLARAVDPAALERDRMAAMQAGFDAGGRGLLRAIVYAALQERATALAHRNTGRACGDPVGQRLLARIAADETSHMAFYRDLVDAALAIAPGETLQAIADEAEAFEMPGAGLPGFLRRSLLAAEAGIYDVRQHRDEVLQPLLAHWHLPGRGAGEADRRLQRHLDRLDAIATRFERRRERRRETRGEAGSAGG